MQQRFAMALLLALLAAGGGTARAGELMGCPTARSEECPPYELLEAGDDFDLRRYQPSDWVESASGSFMALFGYISDFGIPMTAPVLMSHGGGAEQDGTMAFYLAEPGPQPDGQDVAVLQYPTTDFYVHSYGGFSNDAEAARQVEQLKASLDAAGKAYDESYYLSAGYDAPFTFFGRHNEVWLQAAAANATAANATDPTL